MCCEKDGFGGKVGGGRGCAFEEGGKVRFDGCHDGRGMRIMTFCTSLSGMLSSASGDARSENS